MSEQKDLTHEELCLAVMSGKRIQCQAIKGSTGPVVWPNSAAMYYKLRIHPEDRDGLLLTTLKQVADALDAGVQLEYSRKLSTSPYGVYEALGQWQTLPKDATQISLGRYAYRCASGLQVSEVYLYKHAEGSLHTALHGFPQGQYTRLAKSFFVWKPGEADTAE